MSLIAKFSQRAQVLRETTEQFAEMSYELTDHYVRDDGTAKFLLWAEGPSQAQLSDFEAAVQRDETVDHVTQLTTVGDRRYYSIVLTVAATESLTFGLAEATDVSYLTVQTREDRVHITARVPDRDALQCYIAGCEERDIDVRLTALFAESDSGGSQYGLTPRQSEALVNAYDGGHYDSPRRRSLSKLADALEISPQATSKLLRRGHRQLVRATLIDGI